MNTTDYNRFRLLEYIQKRKQVARGKLTREILWRLRVDMPVYNSYIVWALSDGYLMVTTEHIPGKRGMPPKVYTVTPKGNKWLKDMRRQAKKELEGLQ